MTSLNQAEEQIIKIKLKLLKLTSLKDIKEQIIKIKTDITDIDIAESKIQLKRISLQLNPREGEKEPTELKKREKEPTELKKERRNLLNPREGKGTYRTQEEREGTN